LKALLAEIPRLNQDKDGLIEWIENSGGHFVPLMKCEVTGWSLVMPSAVNENEIIAAIPKTICISSSTKTSTQTESPLLESTQNLMLSLHEKLWRARLAVAILSERVRPQSPFRCYIRNLPFEFRVIHCII
jgi:hypothetical protein